MESAGSELPSEIIWFQILPRVPSKSLMRFKCVCKSWSSLVRNPSFVDAHQSFHRNKLTHLLLTTWDRATRQQHFLSAQINQDGTPTPAIHLLNLPMGSDHRLYNAQSTNGLVCLYLSNNLSRHHTLAYLDPPNFIFNPCTRESIILPHASPAYCTSHVTYHFGFSPLTNEYKVLQVQTFRPHDSIPTDMTFMFKIFKLGTSLWRRLEIDRNDLPFEPLKCPFAVQSVCINGAMHWMHLKENVVVVFDIGDEKFRVIPLPQDYVSFIHRIGYPMGDAMRNVVEVGGCLALIGDKKLVRSQNMMALWILKDYENQVWIREAITFPLRWRALGCPVPLRTIHNGELLLQSIELHVHEAPDHVRVHVYNMESNSFRGSEIGLPWAFLNDARLKLVVCYDDNIVPLR
ncbi:F-box protein At4g19940-like [Malus sylvestris]|uniref:F-box protein At4g19940-like n=1 Tax=Malus sylvestris TaxID=3752 RepID=UPI0021ABE73C|nr:F-box protein At4g19940-like [Malus sylvestris]